MKNIGEGEKEQFISDIIQKAKESNLHHLEIAPFYCRKNKNWPCDRLLIVLTLVLQRNKKNICTILLIGWFQETFENSVLCFDKRVYRKQAQYINLL